MKKKILESGWKQNRKKRTTNEAYTFFVTSIYSWDLIKYANFCHRKSPDIFYLSLKLLEYLWPAYKWVIIPSISDSLYSVIIKTLLRLKSETVLFKSVWIIFLISRFCSQNKFSDRKEFIDYLLNIFLVSRIFWTIWMFLYQS